MKNSVYLSDSLLLSAPNIDHFTNNIFYTPSREYYDIALNSDEILKNVSRPNFDMMQNYLESSNYKYENEYHFFDRSLTENIQNVNVFKIPVEYKLNKYLFRCDQFTSIYKGLHILFAGCSETFGEGGNINDNWSKKLYDQIKLNNEVSGYFNISSPGFGWEDIIHNVQRYVELFGSPDIIFILAPNVVRYLEYEKESDNFKMVHKYPLNTKNKKYFKLYAEKFVSWTFMFKSFVNYCNTKKIKIFFTSWSRHDNDNFKKIKSFSNLFIHPGIILTVDDLENLYNNLQADDILRRDGNHRGNIFHTNIANKFIESLNANQISNKLNKIDLIERNLSLKTVDGDF